MVKRAWVFRCDNYASCSEYVLGYIESKKEAIKVAIERGWTVNRYAGGTYYCYCPKCSKEKTTEEK